MLKRFVLKEKRFTPGLRLILSAVIFLAAACDLLPEAEGVMGDIGIDGTMIVYPAEGAHFSVGDFVDIIGGKGASPSDKSIQTGFHNLKKLIKNPLRIYRVFYYILYLPLLILSKIFKS